VPTFRRVHRGGALESIISPGISCVDMALRRAVARYVESPKASGAPPMGFPPSFTARAFALSSFAGAGADCFRPFAPLASMDAASHEDAASSICLIRLSSSASPNAVPVLSLGNTSRAILQALRNTSASVTACVKGIVTFAVGCLNSRHK
jgi:hypothetical protein